MAELKKLKRVVLEYDDGSKDDLAGFIINPSLQPVKITPLRVAIDTYIKSCTLQKCIENQNSEKLYFKILFEYLAAEGVATVNEISPEHMDRFYAQLKKKMKLSSVVRRFCTIKHFFKKCIEWKFIVESPCKHIVRKKAERNPFKPWTKEVFNRFIKESDNEFKPLFEFLWMTGCRPIEAKNLRWADIDYDNKELTFKCGKNAEVSRKFPITKKLDRFLHKIKMQGSHVFYQFNADNLYHHCKKRMNRLGLKNYTVYGLRHGFGTRLAKQGVNSFYIAYLMGHSDLKTTQGYIHFEKNQLIEILNKAN